MRIAIWPVERAGPYARPLTAAGHEIVPAGTPAEVLLIDFDSDHPPHSDAIAYYRSIGARVFMYPHGAGVLTAYDGIHPVTPGLDGAFVIGEGQCEVMRRHGYPVPTYAIGWPFGEAHAPFRACADVKRVLFAPWHPVYHRWIVPEFAAANRRGVQRAAGAGRHRADGAPHRLAGAQRPLARGRRALRAGSAGRHRRPTCRAPTPS